MRQHEPRGDLVGRVDEEVACIAQGGGRVVELVEERSAEDERADLVQPVLEGDDDAEVAGAAAQAPEEIRVLGLGGGDEPPVGRDEVHGEQVVDRQAVIGARAIRCRRRA